VLAPAYGDDFLRSQAMAAGAVAFLSKPFLDRSLREAIRRSLAGEAGAPDAGRSAP